MRKHPELQSGKFSAAFTFKHAQKLWERITDELHQIPGAVKNWKQWRKVYTIMTGSLNFLYRRKRYIFKIIY